MKEFVDKVYGFNGAPDNSALAKLPLSTFAAMLRFDTTGINAGIMTLTFNEAYNFAIQAITYLTSHYPELKDSLPIALIKDAGLQVVNWAGKLNSEPNAAKGLSTSLENFIRAFSYLATAMNGINDQSAIIGLSMKASEGFIKTNGWDSIDHFWSRGDYIPATGDEMMFTVLLPLGGLGAESAHIVRAYAVPILAGLFNDELTPAQKAMYVPIAFGIGKGTEKLWEGLLTVSADTAIGRAITTGLKGYAADATDAVENYLTKAKTGIISIGKEWTDELGGFFTEVAGKAGQAIQAIGTIAKDESSKFSDILMRTDVDGIAGEIFGPGAEAAYRACDIGIREAIKGIQGFTGKVTQFIGERSPFRIGKTIETNTGFGRAIKATSESAYGWRDLAVKATEGFIKATEGFRTFAVSYIGEGLQGVAKTVKDLPAKLVSGYINDHFKGAVVDFSEGKGPLAGAAAGLSEAWTSAWGEAGIRQGWLAYGLTGGALAPLAAYSIALPMGEFFAAQTISGIKDFISPDFTSDTSFGKQFWTGVYEDVNKFYAPVADFVNPDFTNTSSFGANFWVGVYDDMAYAKDFWGKTTHDTLFRTDKELGRQNVYDFKNARTIIEKGESIGGDTGKWSGVFDIRNSYHIKAIDNLTPSVAALHMPRICLDSGSKNYDFTLNTDYSVEDLKKVDSINLFVHGYNTDEKDAVRFETKYINELKAQGYSNPSAVIYWSSDIGSNSVSKLALFNRDVQSAEISWPSLANVVDYIKGINPDIKINVITYSLGFDLVAEAAAHDVHFNSVIAIVPAIHNEDICIGGKYEDAISNMGKLRVLYSKNQPGVFGVVYRLAQFDNALGYYGPSGMINHPDFEAVDATKYIKGHGDIYEQNTISYMIKTLNEKQERRAEELWKLKR